ncbi:unnamed protein product [Allacma fusca]|uniref:Uncharacterized protein n=1 Tax=Allacma fusca TaxID=39272 RepID=A0A8J2LJE2_9HEXA|nr:unnamed protein product [Allacma fusca]
MWFVNRMLTFLRKIVDAIWNVLKAIRSLSPIYLDLPAFGNNAENPEGEEFFDALDDVPWLQEGTRQRGKCPRG